MNGNQKVWRERPTRVVLSSRWRNYPSPTELKDTMRSSNRLGAMKLRYICALSMLVFVGQCFAQGAVTSEYQVKAAYLFNFAKFVEWPAEAFRSPDAPLQLCVAGADPFNHLLEDSLAGKIVNGRHLSVVHLLRPFDTKSCQILFIARSEQGETKEIVHHLTGLGVLTVGDTSGFTSDGGMINFVLEGDRVRFVVNDAAAAQAHLKLSARLFTVAKAVVNRPLDGKAK